jgi:hypothetical protein
MAASINFCPSMERRKLIRKEMKPDSGFAPTSSHACCVSEDNEGLLRRCEGLHRSMNGIPGSLNHCQSFDGQLRDTEPKRGLLNCCEV